MNYTYQYPHPAVTTDIVIFSVRDNALQVLLIKRGGEPFKGSWALPGGFVRIDESLDECAKRELHEEAGLEDVYLEQLYSFGKIGRDPRERVISVAYFTLTPSEHLKPSAGTDASDVKWFAISELPELAFDHAEIIRVARERLAAKMEYSTIGLQFMNEEFTLSQLQIVYEQATGKTLDKRNFRKWILSLDLIAETGKKFAAGAHRPAMLYRIKDPDRVDIIR
ncbi:NUDIX hydrolase [Kordiimonas gwangyangensis]|uniref:NUDIX hydrolase n=1 Tax=Kordiimonas gwangyangensis TaxID=288022 RepID=UPI00037394BB|nr:NUDIX domain-containing protein [Kordiimonas gwangyangensis]